MSAESGTAGQQAGPADDPGIAPDLWRRGGEPRRQRRGSSGAPARRRWAWAAALTLVAVLLFVAYLRLSNTYPEDSDQANLGLQAWDMLHGNVLLHGWTLSDVSFYTTELPQYMLLELLLGLNAGTFHAAAAMTYTLALLLAVLLAKGRAAGRDGVLRALVTGGIMVAPQLGFGVFVLLLTVGHIGTSVPLLLIWLLIDRARPHWLTVVLAGLMLTWGEMADSLVLAVGALPLGIVCGLRVVQGLFTAPGARGPLGRARGALRSRWYELSLGVAAVASVGLSSLAVKVVHALGGYTLHAVTFNIEPIGKWAGNLPATWYGFILLFGGDYNGLKPSVSLGLAFLHLVGVALVILSLILALRRFFTRATLIDQVLAVAILANLVLYLISNMPSLNPHELAVVLPFGAALAGRMLVGRGQRGGVHAGARRTRGAPRAVRAVTLAAGALVLAGYLAGLAHEATRLPQPAQNTHLASWLAGHHLYNGLGGYWESGITTVDSGGRVTVRALVKATLQADMWEAKDTWYDPATQHANFVVFESLPGFYHHWEPRALASKYFGRPARTYNYGPYTVMVWDKNLMASIPPG